MTQQISPSYLPSVSRKDGELWLRPFLFHLLANCDEVALLGSKTARSMPNEPKAKGVPPDWRKA
jgi:hypothetical protein